MVKKKITYSNNYKEEISTGGNFTHSYPDKKDNIDDFLKENYLVLSSKQDDSQYLSYLEKGIMKINSEKTPGYDYKRILEIEIMPPSLNLPSELETILSQKKFNKIKEE